MRKSDKYTIEPRLIKKQLQKILSSVPFKHSDLLSRFLNFVVEETLGGSANQIKEYTVATNVLGRSADFNPRTDASVRILAGRLRRLLEQYYQSPGSKDDILITVPKGGYVPVFRRYSAEDLQNRILKAPAFRNNAQQALNHRKVTLAVFPFKDISKESSDTQFAETMGEQLSNDLAKFQHLSVISYYTIPESVIEKNDISELNKIYDIDYMLSGNVHFFDNVVRINCRFVCAATGTVAWSQSFDRSYTATDLYSIQDEIIGQVLGQIADTDGIITENVINGPLSSKKDVFGIYYSIYRYFACRKKFDIDGYNLTRADLDHALNIDPENALLWSVRANLFLDNHILQLGKGDGDIEKAKDYAEKALWLDRNCQHAYEALAWVYLLAGKKDDCIESIERCLDLNPRSLYISGSMGFVMGCIGKYEQAYKLLLRSMHAHTLGSWQAALGLALYHYNKGDYKGALEFIDNHVVPEFPLTRIVGIATHKKLNSPHKKNAAGASLGPQTTEQAIPILHQFIHDARLREKLADALADMT